jgi:Holliday junction resolvase
MTTEKSITLSIRKYLKSIGAKVYKIHGSGMGVNGAPDLLGAYAGRPLALEVKQPGEQLTALQEKELKELAAAGAIAARVESVEDVKKIIGGIS